MFCTVGRVFEAHHAPLVGLEDSAHRTERGLPESAQAPSDTLRKVFSLLPRPQFHISNQEAVLLQQRFFFEIRRRSRPGSGTLEVGATS
jgi:hypothetical protein